MMKNDEKDQAIVVLSLLTIDEFHGTTNALIILYVLTRRSPYEQPQLHLP